MQKFDPAGHVGNFVVKGLIVGAGLNWLRAMCSGGFLEYTKDTFCFLKSRIFLTC